MRSICLLVLPVLLAGCATTRPAVAQNSPKAAPAPVAVAAVSPTKVVETAYEIRGYRDAAHPELRHATHIVYRRTRVPATAGDELATVPRTTYPPISFTPLPASEELAAELATQKAITTQLRVMQTSMADTERQMQGQYAQIVRQNAEVLKVRDQLETERIRVRATVAREPAKPAVTPTEVTPEVKW